MSTPVHVTPDESGVVLTLTREAAVAIAADLARLRTGISDGLLRTVQLTIPWVEVPALADELIDYADDHAHGAFDPEHEASA